MADDKEKFLAVMENMLDAVLLLDASHHVEYINRAGIEIFQSGGRYADEVATWQPVELSLAWLDEILHKMEADGEAEKFFETPLLTRRGARQYYVKVRRLAENGSPAGSLAILTDVTARQRAEKIQVALYLISSAASQSKDLFDLCRLIHMFLGRLVPVENFYIALYDAGLDLLSFPYFVDQYDQPPPPKTPGRGLTEYVLRTGDPVLVTPEIFEELVAQGEVEPIGAPSLDWLGVPLKLEGQTIGVMVIQTYIEGVRYGQEEVNVLSFLSDQIAMVIERKRSEEALRSSVERYQLLFNEMLDAFALHEIITDASGKPVDYRFLEVNPSFERLTQLRADFVVGKTVRQAIPGLDPAWIERYGKVALTGEPALFEQFEAGLQRYFRGTAFSPRKGQFAVIFNDVTERRLTEEKLSFLSTHDPLTGLFNRFHFQESLARCEQGSSYPVSIIVADVDGLKHTNDTLGHAAGDELLRRAAELLQGAVRSMDVVARIGGDEFAILLPGATSAAVHAILRRLREKIRAHNAGHKSQPVGISFGAATAKTRRPLEKVLHQADQRMYLDKVTRLGSGARPA